MSYRERTKAFCAAILLIAKNATIVIPVIEGIIYTMIDMVKQIKEKKNGRHTQTGLSEIRDAEVSEKVSTTDSNNE